MGSGTNRRFACPVKDVPSRELHRWDGYGRYTNQRTVGMGKLAMPKKPLPPLMMTSNVGKNPPFVPETFKMTVGPPPAKGVYQEAGLRLNEYDYAYAGQNQTAAINQTFRP